jgi:tRNA uridine 5-carboxymethylaminomethyl modification enzyme
MSSTWVQPKSETAQQLNTKLTTPLTREYNLADLIKRPELTYADIAQLDEHAVQDPQVAEQVEIQFKYAGYIDRQIEDIEKVRQQENTPLPADFDYEVVGGLSNELKSKLQQQRPVSIAQASRIQGMTPAAISLLLVHLKKQQMVKRQQKVAG